ncbi:hypothetical protein UNDKW_2629 [Undibacterium sp. KW1]|uniref:DUF6265 family protein n=1 Tax=Undibacterium sp. KW1 TaxID=2058624 RepID=UPI001331DC11|nr:DUF6265 family protein [Undibacterium sp. KW1]BBB60902.1 hypothetical protein UNDKW_2629 [Undibacterium sp. KW1]
MCFKFALFASILIMANNSLAANTIQDLQWLQGCWQAAGAEAGSEEYWLAPAGGSILGMGRTVRKSKTVAWEFMRIQENADSLVFTALPSGKPEASFQLLSLDKQRVVFENPRSEFPQRIIYQLNADGSLLGRIEGKMKDQEKGIDFPMQRISCTKQ